jgi:alanine-alpha-ketoisovalerate/valine-pyruvate aminotransferase
MGKGCKILHHDCDPSLAQDKNLPSNAFLIEYSQAGIAHFDIVSAAKQVDIFDDYWDKYKKDFKTMSQSEGRIDPRIWKAPKK